MGLSIFEAIGCRGHGNEPNTFGDQTSTRLLSNLERATNTLTPGQIFTIKRTFDGTAGAIHSVIYKGHIIVGRMPDFRAMDHRSHKRRFRVAAMRKSEVTDDLWKAGLPSNRASERCR
jgi:hypothetical protein